MANDYLVRKWKQLFRLNDVDRDNYLTFKDADIFAERFCAAHKFNDEKTKQIKEKNHLFWKGYVLVGAAEKVNEAEYIQILTRRINTNPEELYNDLMESIKIFSEIVDVNNDGLISTADLKLLFDTWGADALDETFIARFPQVKPGYINIIDYAKPWIDHLINPDEKVANPVSEGLKALSDAGILP